MVTASFLAWALHRQDEINRHQPRCPRCQSPQVQIMNISRPAQWKCRICHLPFVSEPKPKGFSHDPRPQTKPPAQ